MGWTDPWGLGRVPTRLEMPPGLCFAAVGTRPRITAVNRPRRAGMEPTVEPDR